MVFWIRVWFLSSPHGIMKLIPVNSALIGPPPLSERHLECTTSAGYFMVDDCHGGGSAYSGRFLLGL